VRFYCIMRILLIGEYSNLHATLARGLRELGHEVVVASNGDSWKNYERDIDLQRRPGWWGKMSFMVRLYRALPKMRDFDVVQIVNPIFLELKAERILPIYKYLRKNNGKIIMGAFGMDYYWVQVNTELRPMRYSDFNLGDVIRHDADAETMRRGWVDTPKEFLNRYIADDCDGINTCLYEYQVTYEAAEGGKWASKTHYVPLPMAIEEASVSGKLEKEALSAPKKIRIFVGISRNRSAYKGTDIMLRAARRVAAEYDNNVELLVAEGVPFNRYQQLIESADVLLDQLYSYTPAMNVLLAM